MRKVKLILLYLALLSSFVFAQKTNQIVVNGLLNQSNGLPPGSIYKSLHSFRGHLWLATQAGLFIYDGKFSYKIKISDKKDIIPTFLEEDTHGNLWIGSNNGLYKLNHSTFQAEERIEVKITGLVLGSGNVWVSTMANQLYQISLRDNQLQLIHSFSLTENKVPTFVEELCLDDFGNLWARFDGKIYQYHIQSKKIDKYDFHNSKRLYLHDGKLVVSFSKTEIIVIEKGEIKKRLPLDVKEWTFPFYYSPDEIAILISKNNLAILNTKNWELQNIEQLKFPENVVHINEVRLFDQTILITCNAGLLTLSKTNNFFLKKFAGKSLRSIYQDSKKNFWIASYNGLFVADEKLTSIERLEFSDYPYCFLGLDGQMFIGTEGNGLFQYINGKLKKINHNLFNRGKEIYCLEWIAEDSAIWAGTSHGILIIKPNLETIQYIQNAKYSSFAQTDVSVIKKTQKNMIWVGTRDGLYRARKQNNVWVWDQPIPELANVGITDIKWGNNMMWVGTTRNGVYKVNSYLNFIRYNFSNGLSSDNIVKIEFGNTNDIWVSTDLGLNHIEGENVEAFFETDGLLNNEFNYSSSFANKDFIFFGGINGLSYFSKSNPPIIYNQNQVYITSLIYQEAKSNKIQNLSSYKNQNIIISTENPSLTIKMGCSEFSFPWLTRFKYKFDNDSVWTFCGTERTLQLSSLEAGTHKIYLSSCGANGKWSSKFISVSFTVEKAHWLTFYDFQMIFISFVILVTGYFLLKKRFILKRREIEIQVGKIIQNEMIPPINRKVILTEKIKSRFPEVENICEMLYETNLDSKFLIEELSESLINPHEDLLTWYKNWKNRIEHLLIFNEIDWEDNISIDNKVTIEYIEEFYLSIICKELLQIYIHNKVSKLQFSIFPDEKCWKLIFFAPESKINLTEQQTFWLIEQLDRQISSVSLEYKMLQENGFGLEIVKKTVEN